MKKVFFHLLALAVILTGLPGAWRYCASSGYVRTLQQLQNDGLQTTLAQPLNGMSTVGFYALKSRSPDLPGHMVVYAPTEGDGDKLGLLVDIYDERSKGYLQGAAKKGFTRSCVGLFRKVSSLPPEARPPSSGGHEDLFSDADERFIFHAAFCPFILGPPPEALHRRASRLLSDWRATLPKDVDMEQLYADPYLDDWSP